MTTVRAAVAAALFAAVLIASGSLLAEPPADVVAEYLTRRIQTDHDADSQIGLALWCDEHGLIKEGSEHLESALDAEPGNARARALLGMVKYKDRWLKHDDVVALLKSDAKYQALLDEYHRLRTAALDKSKDQSKLALWCDEHKLMDEARAHYWTVLRLDPKNEQAWKRLGFKKVKGHWTNDAILTAVKAEAETRRRADKRWQAELTRTRELLAHGDPARRRAAAVRLETITNPLAIPAIWRVLVAPGNPKDQALAAQILGRIVSPEASRSLARLTVVSRSEDVRRLATEIIRHRDPREFVDILITLIRDPVEYEVRYIERPGSVGALFVKGKRFSTRRNYITPIAPFAQTMPGDWITYDEQGLTVIERKTSTPVSADGSNLMFIFEGIQDIPIGQALAENEREVKSVQLQLETDIDFIDRYNMCVMQTNQCAGSILSMVSGLSADSSRETWNNWWIDLFGYHYVPDTTYARTLVQNFGPSTVLQTAPAIDETQVALTNGKRIGCFVLRTPVWTSGGMRSIESVRPGDLVLTRDLKTGELSYKPVLFAHAGPPAKILQVQLKSGEVISGAPYHCYWKPGKGWAPALDLKVGDVIRLEKGVDKITSIVPGGIQPVFNVDVADTSTLFAGKVGVLTHDNSPVRSRVIRFDPTESGTSDP